LKYFILYLSTIAITYFIQRKIFQINEKELDFVVLYLIFLFTPIANISISMIILVMQWLEKKDKSSIKKFYMLKQ